MGIINLLDIQTANLIAAGEVVERPASAVKELCENCIDANAHTITVEIKGGGNSYIRVSDDGCGISDDDLPKAVLRHATSKIRTGADIDGVMTLGFRGEALAAIASVSRLQIITRCHGESIGRILVSNDTDGVVISETGCPEGTTVIVRDLFYNVPARRKFLKKDTTESAAVGAVVEKLALSHPELSFKYIVQGEQKLVTSGDGKLMSTIYAVCGRPFAQTLNEINYTESDMSVKGYISHPGSPRGSRGMQTFFINNRYIRSRTVTAALEEAYSSYIPRGRFPAGILHITINPKTVDVNVHPSKSEVKFSDEKKIFDLVYYGVRSVLMASPERAVFTLAPKEQNDVPDAALVQEQQSHPIPTVQRAAAVFDGARITSADNDIVDDGELHLTLEAQPPETSKAESAQTAMTNEPEYRFVGEVFNAYAIVECSDGLYLIDKHAAHERILYEDLKSSNKRYAQQLFEPVELILSAQECNALLENAALLSQYGFEFKKKQNTLLLTAIPDIISCSASSVNDFISSLASKLTDGDTLPVQERTDRALFTVACKAALKAGIYNDPAHTEWVVRRVMTDERITYCPHGRPVIHLIDRRDIDRFFDR